MKKIILLSTVVFCCLQCVIFCSNAQILYGTTSGGGNEGAGTINRFIPSANSLIVAKSFEGISWGGASPYGSLVQASNGRFYGMTTDGGSFSGGSSGVGVIFSFDPSSSNYTKQKDFDFVDGANPVGSLIQATDGKLYGMTQWGGSYHGYGYYGAIFSFDPATSAYSKIKDFDEKNGANPFGSLVQASNGKLYGMTRSGGSNRVGVIFSFDPATSAYSKIKDFDYINGARPLGSLMQASDGKLYGMTQYGGSSGLGVIFSFDPSTSTYAKLKDFDGRNGTNPFGSLMQASDGKLYGMTTKVAGSADVGVIFSFDPSTSKYTKLKDFDNTNGLSSYGSLMQASDGKLYGMTTGGGNSNSGVIFSFDPFTSSCTKLKDFNRIDGASPFGSLIQANDGRLYGMTSQGGSSDIGLIFSYDLSSSVYTKLKVFESKTGAYPSGSLIRASDKKLYGMTFAGGSSNAGVIFSFDPSSSTYTKLSDFDSTNGAAPRGSLMLASDGKFYGLTRGGGSSNNGVIFSFDPATSKYTKLKDFDRTNGAYPNGSLVQAKDGKFYGMTNSGGSSDGGVIFSFDPATSNYTKLKDFDKINGLNPYGSLIQAGDGKLYGTTRFGGNSGGSSTYGVIFSFDPATFTYTKLKDFGNYINGINPYGSFIQASDGKLYGEAKGGVGGVIFSFDPGTSIYRKRTDLDYTYGVHPTGLMQASDGKLYGMTSQAGRNGEADVIFSFDPATSTYTKLIGFNGGIVTNPSDGSVFIEVNISDTAPIVKITSPANNATYTSLATVLLSANATDADGTVKTVDFYNGTQLIFTETWPPFYRQWYNVPAGDYTITAKSTDDKGLSTTSAPVHITVLSSDFLTANITSPGNGTIFAAPATFTITADVKGPNEIVKTDFYNGSTLIFSEHLFPYSNKWRNVPAGNYSITAKATDNKGNVATSVPVAISVKSAASATVVSNKPVSLNSKTNLRDAVSVQLMPNPANNILNIRTTGLRRNKQLIISVISTSGVIMQTRQFSSSTQTIQLNVSSIVSGVYTIKFVSGDKILYKQFVKL